MSDDQKLMVHTADKLKPILIHIKATDFGGLVLSRSVFLIVCGEEIVEPLASMPQPQIFNLAKQAQNSLYYVANFQLWLSSTIPECPILSYQLLTSSGSIYVASSPT